MRNIVSAALGAFWMVAGYFILLRVGSLFFRGRFRAETAAAAVIFAFIVGANWPQSKQQLDAEVTPANTIAATPLATAPIGLGAEVGEACRSARLVPGVGQGHIDGLNARSDAGSAAIVAATRLGENDTVVMSGWSANSDLKSPATAVCVVLDGRIFPNATIRYGGSRPDVAAAYHNVALTPTAFEILVPAAILPKGPHLISVAAVKPGGSAALLSGAFHVTR